MYYFRLFLNFFFSVSPVTLNWARKITAHLLACQLIFYLLICTFLFFLGVPPTYYWLVVLWESRVWRLSIPWSATVNRQIYRFLCFPHCHRSYRRCCMREHARHGWANRLCRKEVLFQAVQCGETDWWRICEVLVFVGKLCVHALE